MCDLVCDAISCDTGKINANDKIMIENEKREKMWKSGNVYTNLHLKDGL